MATGPRPITITPIHQYERIASDRPSSIRAVNGSECPACAKIEPNFGNT
jgi:hypothetical protein